jgi:hypothetical protein
VRTVRTYPKLNKTGSHALDDHPVQFAVLKLGGGAASTPVAEFLEIVRGVAGLRHPNVEELVGCCVDHGQRLLVYRRVDGLRDLGRSELGTMPWDARVTVALEAAKALEYV